MSLSFFGWKACREKRRRLKPGQAPRGGRSYTMYHGTHKNNAKAIITTGFHQSQGGTLGPGVYCSRDIKKASSYPALCGPADRVVLELRVRVGKVKRIDGQGLQLQTSWHQHGYDTAWMPASGGRFEEDCVWDPKRLSVVGVVHCSDPAVRSQLEGLIQQHSRGQKGGGQGQGQGQGHCRTCGGAAQGGHQLETCWGCRDTICPFMGTHVCKRGN
ncbi:uncharacterized protein LOC136752193 [Amia ocellicauda]|uniref:uncharacterized protein LOC136752193 n=1 Tax=Amia ocellicauda TaxID=2972642 RepID=UPI003464A786